MSIAIGLLVIRVIVGGVLMGHGAQKLFGAFGGGGLTGTTGFLQKLGFKPAGFWALLGSVGEFGGGLLLVLGLLSPLGALGVFASMLMAVLKFHWSKGFWSMQGGYEYPLVLALVALGLGMIGPGTYALDTLIGFALPTPWFLIGVALAILVDLIGLISSRQPASQQQQQVA